MARIEKDFLGEKELPLQTQIAFIRRKMVKEGMS